MIGNPSSALPPRTSISLDSSYVALHKQALKQCWLLILVQAFNFVDEAAMCQSIWAGISPLVLLTWTLNASTNRSGRPITGLLD